MFKQEKWDFLIPDELQKNFEHVLEGIQVKGEKQQNFAYPELTKNLRSLDKEPELSNDDDLFEYIKKNINQIFLPDRELSTPLHQLFSKKKFELLHNIRQYLSSNLAVLNHCISETDAQFKYIYKYHYKFEKKLFKRVYIDFDYLFADVDFYQLDEDMEVTMEFFSAKLREIAEKIIKDFDLK